ncbi:hypothetical protein BpHYR1_004483 [Brachionus plicatilis]|uniref:Uncharacterized protein n=1 Tax=Brachionus plicatilis TaxID=10195 RepID=A0A3M7S9H8_BRAPC|nr:hypothetical protein BpHYR1_004483 [Brachionus plicatilis]
MELVDGRGVDLSWDASRRFRSKDRSVDVSLFVLDVRCWNQCQTIYAWNHKKTSLIVSCNCLWNQEISQLMIVLKVGEIKTGMKRNRMMECMPSHKLPLPMRGLETGGAGVRPRVLFELELDHTLVSLNWYQELKYRNLDERQNSLQQ